MSGLEDLSPRLRDRVLVPTRGEDHKAEISLRNSPAGEKVGESRSRSPERLKMRLLKERDSFCKLRPIIREGQTCRTHQKPVAKKEEGRGGKVF